MVKLKTNKTFTKKKQEKKLRTKRIKIKLKNIIYDKLELKDEIENK
jgi:hypothetical protein